MELLKIKVQKHSVFNLHFILDKKGKYTLKYIKQIIVSKNFTEHVFAD